MAKWNIQTLKNIKYGELFSNIGGFGWGFHEAGAECVFAVDNNRVAVDFYNKIFPPVSQKIDVREFQHDEHLNLLLFGFPCNSFSSFGERKGENSEKYGKLWKECCRIIKSTNTDFFIAENVANIIDFSCWPEIYKDFCQCGYTVNCMLLDFAELGSPSHRKRILIFGSKKGLPVFFPERLKCVKKPPFNVKKWLLRFNFPEAHHWPSEKKKIELSRQGKPIRSGHKNVAENVPWRCIVAQGTGMESGLLDYKKLPTLAYPLLMTFPKSLFLGCSDRFVRRACGMAVPPLVSRLLALEFAKFLHENKINLKGECNNDNRR